MNFSLHKIDVIPKRLSTKTRFRGREGTVVSTHWGIIWQRPASWPAIGKLLNTYLVIAGFLTILLSIAHTIIGEILILIPLQKAEGLPAVRGSVSTTKRTLRFTWHITSVLGIGIAFLLFHYAKFAELTPDHRYVLSIMSLTFFVSFVVSLVGSKARHPSWIVFLIVSILIWLGMN